MGIRPTLSRWALVLSSIGSLGLAACGDPNGISGPDGQKPFGGREINFQSYYAAFPTDFGVTIVRDTLPYKQACELQTKYNRTPPPSPVEHYSLLMIIESVTQGDDITVDINNRGPAGDMRSIGLGHYPVGAVVVPAGGFGVDAGGLVRITEFKKNEKVVGSYSIKFRTGEMISGNFDITACSKPSS